MTREEEGEDIDTRGDPAVVRVLHVATVRHFVEVFQRGEVFISHRQILHQGYAADVEEHSHEELEEERELEAQTTIGTITDRDFSHQLKYAPNGQH